MIVSFQQNLPRIVAQAKLLFGTFVNHHLPSKLRCPASPQAFQTAILNSRPLLSLPKSSGWAGWGRALSGRPFTL
jgi:hypothetical protein